MEPLRTCSALVPSARVDAEAIFARVRGEIDLHNSPELRGELMDLIARTNRQRIVLDLSEVPYMDSSAIAVLVELLQKLRKQGGRVYLLKLQPRVRGLLEIARLDTIFKVIEREEEAAGDSGSSE
jgi:anti-anti-sigma factor